MCAGLIQPSRVPSCPSRVRGAEPTAGALHAAQAAHGVIIAGHQLESVSHQSHSSFILHQNHLSLKLETPRHQLQNVSHQLSSTPGKNQEQYVAQKSRAICGPKVKSKAWPKNQRCHVTRLIPGGSSRTRGGGGASRARGRGSWSRSRSLPLGKHRQGSRWRVLPIHRHRPFCLGGGVACRRARAGTGCLGM